MLMSLPENGLKCAFYPDHFWLEGEPEVVISARLHPPHSGFRSKRIFRGYYHPHSSYEKAFIEVSILKGVHIGSIHKYVIDLPTLRLIIL